MGCGTSKPRQIPAPTTITTSTSEPYDGSQLIPGVLHTWDKQSTKVPVLSDLTVVAISVGVEKRLAVTRGGDLFVWEGDNTANIAPVQQHVRSAAIGRRHIVSAAENENGIVSTYTWGTGSDWELGHGTQTDEMEPKEVAGLRGKDVVEVFASNTTSAALTRTGELYMWGSNDFGECGTGSAEPVKEPVEIREELDGRQIIAVALGEHHTLCTCYDGTTWAWGCNNWNQLGLGIDHFGVDQHVPMSIPALAEETIVALACGRNHSMALTDKSDVISWGMNEDNQLGLVEPDPERVHCPENVEGIATLGKKCIRIACGQTSSAALTVDGECIVWGGFPEAKPPVGRGLHVLDEGLEKPVVCISMDEDFALYLQWSDKWA